MKDLSSFARIFVAIDPVDFRNQAHGLSLMAEHALQLTLTCERTLLAFTNKKRDAIKLLYWDGTGLAMWWKVLERERFRWPKSQDQVLNLTSKELRWLLEGVDLASLKKHKKVTF